MDVIKKTYELQAQQLINAFKGRNMEAFYCDNKEDAKNKTLELIAENSTVSFGGSVTLAQTGILDALRNGNYNLLDRDNAETPEKGKQIMYDSFKADYYLLSANAMTIDGKLINIDGRGNRLAAFIFGPKNIIVVASMNKVFLDEKSALERVRNFASPVNVQRLGKKTPCSVTGICADCNSPECICSHIVITRHSQIKNRIKIVLVGENLGF